jgi:hypothetical protein
VTFGHPLTRLTVHLEQEVGGAVTRVLVLQCCLRVGGSRPHHNTSPHPLTTSPHHNPLTRSICGHQALCPNRHPPAASYTHAHLPTITTTRPILTIPPSRPTVLTMVPPPQPSHTPRPQWQPRPLRRTTPSPTVPSPTPCPPEKLVYSLSFSRLAATQSLCSWSWSRLVGYASKAAGVWWVPGDHRVRRTVPGVKRRRTEWA